MTHLVSHSTIQVKEKHLKIWPDGQSISVEAHPTIQSTRFDDIEDFHPNLITQILDMERRGTGRQFRSNAKSAGGTKIYHIDQWESAEANLINARALDLFKRVLQRNQAAVDFSWANIYRHGDYSMPHSHTRSTASIVYFLQTGESSNTDPDEGRFYFVDPRIEDCCRSEQGCMTAPYPPDTSPGTMLIFPSKLVHCVNPYLGETSRLTLAWNINEAALAGSPFPDDNLIIS